MFFFFEQASTRQTNCHYQPVTNSRSNTDAILIWRDISPIPFDLNASISVDSSLQVTHIPLYVIVKSMTLFYQLVPFSHEIQSVQEKR